MILYFLDGFPNQFLSLSFFTLNVRRGTKYSLQFLVIFSLPFSNKCLSLSASCGSLMLLPGLIFLHISNYYINLFLANTQNNDFYYILIKYGLGFSFIIFSPLLIIGTQDEIWQAVKRTFKGNVLCYVPQKTATNKKKFTRQKSVDFAEKVDEV